MTNLKTTCLSMGDELDYSVESQVSDNGSFGEWIQYIYGPTWSQISLFQSMSIYWCIDAF